MSSFRGEERRNCVERPLDTVESIFYAYGRVGAFLTVQHATLSESFDEETLWQAAASVQERHPVLRARVVLDGGVPRWHTPFDEGPPPLTLVPPQDSRALVEAELHRPLDLGREPPWRCLVVPSRRPGGPMELVLACSHAAADGRSASVVLMDFVAACAAIRDGRPLPPPREPAPPLDGVLPHARLPAVVGHRMRRLLARVRPTAVATVAADPPAPEARRSRVAVGTLPPVPLQALLTRARAEDTTLTGALSAGLVASLRRYKVPAASVTIAHAVSLRELARPAISADDVGCYVSVVPTSHEVDLPRPFWDVAREAISGVRRILRRGDVTAGIQASRGKYGKIAEAAHRTATDPGQAGRIGSVTLSNRGLLPERRLGSLRLDGWYSATSNHSVGNELNLSVGTLGGTLSCALVYVEPIIPRLLAEGVLDGLLDILRAAASF